MLDRVSTDLGPWSGYHVLAQNPLPTTCFALAGLDTEHERKKWQNALEAEPYLAKNIQKSPLIVNDVEATLRSAGDTKNTIALIAGTHDLDDRGPKTQLTNLFFKQYKIASLNELQLLIYQKQWDKTDIAKVAQENSSCE